MVVSATTAEAGGFQGAQRCMRREQKLRERVEVEPVKMSESVNLTVYYVPGNVLYNELGVDLSEFKKCMLTLSDLDRMDIRQLKHWLTTSFELDPEVCSVSIHALWTKTVKMSSGS
ncbi:hypothetical protein D1007_12519 [Hordeum vulgare]|nr:hypothetical protein D1007_12519 [Hordeum vulgare]